MVLLNTRIGLFRQIADNRPGSDPNLVLSHIQEILACSTVRERKRDRHSNSVTRKIASVNLAYLRYYQRTSYGLHMRCFAEKLRITLHWEMHGSLRKMAIEQRNHGCPNQIGSFDAKWVQKVGGTLCSKSGWHLVLCTLPVPRPANDATREK